MKYIPFTMIFFLLAACATQPKTGKSGKTVDDMITTATGLKYSILQKGTGAGAVVGNEVLIYETTTYLDGTVLYSNENTGRPVKVLIGGKQATEGVDEGLRGMQTGEIRKLIVPAHLAKRKSYPANVSPDSTLAIKIALYKIL